MRLFDDPPPFAYLEWPAGPSGGATSDLVQDNTIAWVQANAPDRVREFVTIGRHHRAGHDRSRWATVDWDAYRAQVEKGCQKGEDDGGTA